MSDNKEGYRPPSAFLRDLIRRELPLSGGPTEDWRAAKLISLTRDADAANRDWALCLLQQSSLDTPEVRAALVAGMDDPHHEASLEALIGVAVRDRVTALPRVAALLEGEWISSMVLEAAAIVADASLMPALEAIVAELGADRDDAFDATLREALECCSSGVPPEWRMLG
ncbi:lyase [Sphingomonas sp. M1-B02]|uniref:lyase n=1 Tax=Sphingomonas sp. M1-B02 TaxID=3114300 RepID=UPI00223EB9D4|nr:lyase [Sphingomonas sp. S6-11]UZK64940.1 lyase [Sphingomonas sp. S6-11]